MFEKLSLPSDSGYEAPSTHTFNESDAHLLWGSDGIWDDFYHVDATKLPSRITLNARLDGIPIDHSVNAQLIVDQTSLTKTALYEKGSIQNGYDLFENACYQTLVLSTEPGGSVLHKDTLYTLSEIERLGWIITPPHILYEKTFAFETAHITERCFSPSGLHLSPPTTGHIIRPFGGYLSTDLKQCAQVCYELCEEYPQTTKVSLLRLSDALSNSSERIAFSHPHMTRTSLHNNIVSGHVHTTLTDTSSGTTFPYQSVSYERQDNLHFTINFVPTKEENA